MRAVLVREFGGPEQLRLERVADPGVPPGAPPGERAAVWHEHDQFPRFGGGCGGQEPGSLPGPAEIDRP